MLNYIELRYGNLISQVDTTPSLIAVVLSQRWSEYEWLVASLVNTTASASQLLQVW